jgi:hypothetical protein
MTIGLWFLGKYFILYENSKKYANKVCVQNTELMNVEPGNTYTINDVLNG